MSEAYIGEIRLAAFGVVPNGWAQCNGQLLPISQYQALFSILGTQYGGNGQTNFALPDFRGRLPLHRSATVQNGTNGGEEFHTLTTAEIPPHTHAAVANPGTPTQTSPSAGFWGIPKSSRPLPNPDYAYAPAANLVPLAAAAVGPPSGSGGAHENRSPYLVINFIICLNGIFPSRN